MFPPYIDRLNVIRMMLNSPLPETKHESYDLLYSLYSEYYADSVFIINLKELIEVDSIIAYELISRIRNSNFSKVRKDELLGAIDNLLSLQVKSRPLKIFISYSRNDRPFLEELNTMLAGLRRRNALVVWHDHCIEAGEEWFLSILNAMEDCHLAILLISSDFIASRFIQEEELTRLFSRRIEEGLRVIPIIVRSCMWKQEPTIKDLAVLPRDGIPIINYSKETGARDLVWTEIAEVINDIAGNW